MLTSCYGSHVRLFSYESNVICCFPYCFSYLFYLCLFQFDAWKLSIMISNSVLSTLWSKFDFTCSYLCSNSVCITDFRSVVLSTSCVSECVYMRVCVSPYLPLLTLTFVPAQLCSFPTAMSPDTHTNTHSHTVEKLNLPSERLWKCSTSPKTWTFPLPQQLLVQCIARIQRNRRTGQQVGEQVDK